jgi:hypothetical protein
MAALRSLAQIGTKNEQDSGAAAEDGRVLHRKIAVIYVLRSFENPRILHN